MRHFDALPCEILNEILHYSGTGLARIFILRGISKQLKALLDNHIQLWSRYLDKTDLEVINKHEISYFFFFFNVWRKLKAYYCI